MIKANNKNNVNRMEEQTFDTLFRAHYAPMVLFATRLLGSQEEAEDVVQDVFCKVLNSPDMVDYSSNPKGLLFTMLHNSIIDLQRKNGRRLHTSITDIEDDVLDEQESVMEMDVYSLLYEEIEKLPLRNRDVMKMRMEGVSYNEIAQRLGISKETVRTHVKRGLDTLRGKFDGKMLSVIFL